MTSALTCLKEVLAPQSEAKNTSCAQEYRSMNRASPLPGMPLLSAADLISSYTIQHRQ